MAEDNVQNMYLQEPIFLDHCMSGNILPHLYIEWFHKLHLYLQIDGTVK